MRYEVRVRRYIKGKNGSVRVFKGKRMTCLVDFLGSADSLVEARALRDLHGPAWVLGAGILDTFDYEEVS